MPAWDSKSMTPGTPTLPTPDADTSRPDPVGSTTTVSDYSGFGHERNVPSASPEHEVAPFTSGNFPSAALPWDGGDSQSRGGSNTNSST